jgi:anti-sigma factor RsiW
LSTNGIELASGRRRALTEHVTQEDSACPAEHAHWDLARRHQRNRTRPDLQEVSREPAAIYTCPRGKLGQRHPRGRFAWCIGAFDHRRRGNSKKVA